MAHHETDTIGRVFGLQRAAVREVQAAVWNGLVCQRRVDDAVLAGLRAEAATREAAVELCADTVRSGAGRLDDVLPGAVSTGGPGPLRRLAGRPLDALVGANATVGDALVGTTDEAFDRYEHGLRSILITLNRRVNGLLAKHEALEERLREYAEQVDDEERAEQVAEFRRQLSTLQTDLQTMQARLARYDA
jgi:hypothetical protein